MAAAVRLIIALALLASLAESFWVGHGATVNGGSRLAGALQAGDARGVGGRALGGTVLRASKVQESQAVETVKDIEIDIGVVSIQSAGKKVARRAPPTALGRPHTESSKAKISAANKGKTPWNVGRQHSAETRAKISEKTRLAALRKKGDKAAALGFSLAEFEALQQTGRDVVRKEKLKGGLTEEGRRRISDAMKLRWNAPGFKETYANSTRGTRSHSLETKQRISEAIKLKWQDNEYRDIDRRAPTAEVRARISATLKARWEEPEFREKMMSQSFERTPEWRSLMSEKIREKWTDPEYRNSVQSSIRAHFNSTEFVLRRRQRISEGGPRTRRSRAVPKVKLSAAEVAERRAEALSVRKDKALGRRVALKAAKQAARMRDHSVSLKTLLGGELWFEQKMLRKKEGQMFIEDAALERELRVEWAVKTRTETARRRTATPAGGISGEAEGAGFEEEDYELEEEDLDFDDLDDEDFASIDAEMGIVTANRRRADEEEADPTYYLEEEEDEDMIEVYDENGALVGIYDLAEFQRLQQAMGK
ncbi:hypothetical protein B484DRAFT_418689 [Ochromonadaceae sp. CCMP2298]|nr:hypothetical protein B484DRAFT_418689 [Ochromonadaceae sp. CCMP2298]